MASTRLRQAIRFVSNALRSGEIRLGVRVACWDSSNLNTFLPSIVCSGTPCRGFEAGKIQVKLGILLAAAAMSAVATPAAAAEFVYTGPGAVLVDQIDFTSEIVVGDSFVVDAVKLTLVGLQHSFLRDLSISLTKGTTTVLLLDRTGGRLQPNGNFTFDDAADTPVAEINVVGGTFRPLEMLTAFKGASAQGSWLLRIRDTAPLDAGALEGWQLALSSSDMAPIPEPSIWGTMILGFLGVGAVARRDSRGGAALAKQKADLRGKQPVC